MGGADDAEPGSPKQPSEEKANVTERFRWRLTDVQRLGVIAAACVAFFLASMAWGGTNLLLLLISAVVTAGVGVAVYRLDLYHQSNPHQIGTAEVLTVSKPPRRSVIGRCVMRVRVHLAGRPSVEVPFRDRWMPVVRWPSVGQQLPVQVWFSNPRRLRIRWDLFDLGYPRVPSPTPPDPDVRLHTTYAQEGDEYDEPPEDAGLRLPVRPGTVDSGRLADPTRYPGARRHSDIVDADVVAQHPPAQTIVQQQIPQPRSATELAVRVKGPPAALPSADEVAAEELSAAVSAGGLAGMLFVSDPERSRHFYTEMLGFTIVYTTSSSTMLEYQGARILLLRKADFSGVNSRSVFLLITVPDVDSAYRDLVAKGVAFSHRPKEVSRGNDEVTLVAAFRDPDGHGVALTEWRRRRG